MLSCRFRVALPRRWLGAVTTQHLKDMLFGGSDNVGEVFLEDMTALINLCVVNIDGVNIAFFG